MLLKWHKNEGPCKRMMVTLSGGTEVRAARDAVRLPLPLSGAAPLSHPAWGCGNAGRRVRPPCVVTCFSLLLRVQREHLDFPGLTDTFLFFFCFSEKKAPRTNEFYKLRGRT